MVSFDFQSKLNFWGRKLGKSRAIGQNSSRADLSDHRPSKASYVFFRKNIVNLEELLLHFLKVDILSILKNKKETDKEKRKSKN